MNVKRHNITKPTPSPPTPGCVPRCNASFARQPRAGGPRAGDPGRVPHGVAVADERAHARRARAACAHIGAHKRAQTHRCTQAELWAKVTFLWMCTVSVSVSNLSLAANERGFKSCRRAGAARGGNQMWRRRGGSESFKVSGQSKTDCPMARMK